MLKKYWDPSLQPTYRRYVLQRSRLEPINPVELKSEHTVISLKHIAYNGVVTHSRMNDK